MLYEEKIWKIFVMIYVGLVKDEDGYAVPNATITVDNIDHDVKTTTRGEYWRLLMNGTYYVSASAPG